jgi:hypothetical protein
MSTLQFSACHASQDFADCDVTNLEECVFSETLLLHRRTFLPLLPSAYVSKTTALPIPTLSGIKLLLVKSPKGDLMILKRLGVDVDKIASVVAILDMHLMAHDLLGPNSLFLNGTPPMTRF